MNNLSNFAKRIEGFEQIDPWPQGDHTLFSFSGVPAISVTSSGIFALVDSVLHSDRDSLELIDTEILESLVKFLLYSI